METRKLIKKLLATRDEINSIIQSEMVKYIEELEDDENGLYITDHAIVRYFERIKGLELDSQDTDKAIYQIVNKYGINLAKERKQILPIKLDRKILRSDKSLHTIDGIVYVVKNLAIITIYKDDRLN